MNAQERWKEAYKDWRLDHLFSWEMGNNDRTLMRSYRRAALLERKLAAAQRTIEAQAARITTLESALEVTKDRILALCDKIDANTMGAALSKFERTAPVDWRGYEADKTPLGIALDGGGDEVEG